MTWTADAKKDEARDEHGYRLTWSDNKYGTYFNAYAPSGKSIASGYNQDKVKAECDVHRDRLERGRAMRAAEKAAKEVSREAI
jgi:hypothetical protein